MAKQLLWAVSMYKAKAEIVNGLRVFADGKWLTCVGNKNVQVGDLIWTDGRCVYGFNKISQQPMVIISPTNLYCYTFDKTCEYFDEIAEKITKNGLAYSLDDKKILQVETAERIKFIANDYDGKIYFSNSKTILAVNYDKQGNKYSIETDSENYKVNKPDYTVASDAYSCWSALWYGQILNTKKQLWGNLYIKKNNAIIKKISFFEVAQQVADSAIKICPEPYIATCNINFLDAVIENENAWRVDICLIATVSACDAGAVAHELEIRAQFPEYDLGGTEPHDISNRGIIDMSPEIFFYGATQAISIYNFSSDNEGIKIYNAVQRISYPYDGVSYIPDQAFIASRTESEISDYKHLIQDGFYYKIENFDVDEDTMTCSIYNSASEKIFSGDFAMFTHFSIYQINSQSYLLGIGKISKDYIFYPLHVQKYTKAGLYILANGELKNLDGMENNIPCLNQQFKPMKNFKNWLDNIQALS